MPLSACSTRSSSVSSHRHHPGTVNCASGTPSSPGGGSNAAATPTATMPVKIVETHRPPPLASHRARHGRRRLDDRRRHLARPNLQAHKSHHTRRPPCLLVLIMALVALCVLASGAVVTNGFRSANKLGLTLITAGCIISVATLAGALSLLLLSMIAALLLGFLARMFLGH